MTRKVKTMKQQKKFYVIYQITNNLNGKIYVGKHETDNLDEIERTRKAKIAKEKT